MGTIVSFVANSNPLSTFGDMYSFILTRNGNSNNRWLRLAYHTDDTDSQPFIVPFASEIRRITWSAGGGGQDLMRVFVNGVFQYQLTGTGLNGTEDTTIVLNAGDEVSCFVLDAGGNYDDLFMTFYCVITE